ncbi:hypothetical protein CA13_43070 [Planctomycetes bacterium CA13]|uniref:Uncharacterized protein n=1 Tax=Novipirellula herctigrandis TaxID=2527986 RepID=A0A5C5Z6F6_9BACT|nr:hypothetical protein CA13_43070 [Planctomycetes bacterium CA13]
MKSRLTLPSSILLLVLTISNLNGRDVKVQAAEVTLTGRAPAPVEPLSLWYRQPAERWLESLPVGNGRLGAMVFGGVDSEHLALNESTFWSGRVEPNVVNPTGRENLSKIRELFFDNKYPEATALVKEHLISDPDNYGTHLPVGDLYLAMQHGDGNIDVTNYRRELDLPAAIARVCYSVGQTEFSREVIASHPDDVIVVRLSADQPSNISFDTRFDSQGGPYQVETDGKNRMILTGDARERRHSDGKSGVHSHGIVQVVADGGEVTSSAESLSVRNANSVILYIAINTDYNDVDPKMRSEQQIASAMEKGVDVILKTHLVDHQTLFNRVTLNLGDDKENGIPTDERRERLLTSRLDPPLANLFFQYGRYLMIAGSRADSPLPTNLQGIWNDNRACRMPWTCDFHLDINTQQNYWPAEVCNLSECHEPLFRLISKVQESGRRTARDLYGCNGWVCHVFTNAWGYTAPGWGLGWGLHPTGGIWIASHLWERFLFEQDKSFLAEKAYPVLKDAAHFFLDYLAVDPNTGYLVSGPSISPENAFYGPDGTRGAESMGTVHDQVLIRDLFQSCIDASEILQCDSEFRAKLIAAMKRLPPLKIGKHGQLQEWFEDFAEAVPNHRHTSHLVALFPGSQITPDGTPKLADAARVTIKRRLSQPDWEDVEWSRANMICFEARLRDGDAALRNLTGLMRDLSDVNLLTFSAAGIASAQHNIAVVDGNLAASAGMAEMLLQSHGNEIHLLPALPSAWPTGSFEGLRARGHFEVSATWKEGELASVAITSLSGNPLRIRSAELVKELLTSVGQTYHFNGSLDMTSLE